MATAAAIKESFLSCLANADKQTYPYNYWLLTDVLPEETSDAIASLPFPPATISRYSGKRNTEDDKRVYFNAENRAKFPVCDETAAAFDDPEVRAAIEETCGTDLTDTRLRIEYVQDTDGFWLEPHTDIFVKKYTMLVYLSRDPALHDAGTDVYDSDFNLVATAPYAFNRGLIFIPAANTWHGVRKRPIRGIRKAIIVNYVSPEWRDTWELA